MPVVGSGLPLRVQNHSAGGGPNVRYHHIWMPDVSTGLFLSNEKFMTECGRNASNYAGWLKMVNGIDMSLARGTILPWNGRLMYIVGSCRPLVPDYQADLLLYRNNSLVETFTSFFSSVAGGYTYWSTGAGAGVTYSAGDRFAAYVQHVPPPQNSVDYPLIRAFFVREYA